MDYQHLFLSFIIMLISLKQIGSNFSKEPENQKETTVKSAAGTVIGYIKDVEVFGKPYKVARFLGIPYAEAPTGSLRFQKPVLRKPFSIPLVAKQYGLACLQQDFAFLDGNEVERGGDCLNLNVYKLEDCSVKKLAVMVWFYGGGFVSGSSNPYTADYLAAYGNVIVVTVNYRLSVWGFLSLGDVSPGNNGLWDQHLALKWIHKNIGYFGGDIERVTIFGQSAGAASVVYQSMYEGNQGLFQRAIAQSSSITSPWAFTDKTRDDEIVLGKLLGCDTNEFANFFQCINATSNKDLLDTVNKMPGSSSKLRMSLIPTIDGDFVKEATVSMLSYNSPTLKASQEFFSSLDFLSGVTATESTIHAVLLAGAQPDNMEHFLPDQDVFENYLVPLVMNKLYNQDIPKVILDLVRAQYKGWNQSGAPTVNRANYIHLLCDICHNVPLIQTVQFHARTSERNTYVYSFNEKPSQQICLTPSWSKRAHHSDELQFVFGTGKDGLMS